MSSSTISHSTFASLALLLLLGCAHRSQGGAAARRDLAPPHRRAGATFGEPGGARVHAGGGVTLPDPGKEQDVSLDGILAYADAHSPVLAVARSTRARAHAAHEAASPWSPHNPELTVAAGPRFSGGDTGVDLEASLTQRLEIAGERGLRIEAADRLAERTEAEIEQIRWSVHCDVHAVFHETLVARERTQLAERMLTFQQELLRVVESQVSAGEAPPLTLRLAQAEVAQARQAAVAAAQVHRVARLRLAQLSGWPLDPPPNPSGALDAPRDPPPLAELIATARRQLPLLLTKVAAVREAQARALAADRDSWVEPAVGVQYSREAATGGDQAKDILLGVVSLPLPLAQRNQAGRASSRADAQVARAELDAAHALLAGSIAEVHSQAAAAAERVRSYGSEVLPKIEESLNLLRRAFELGEIDLLELSIGRERFLRIQNDALAAHLDYFVAIAGLERAVGVDLWRDEHHEQVGP
jgi:outer membrane protein, heavy metal efflux system